MAGGKLYEKFSQEQLPIYPKTSMGKGTLLAPLPCVLVTTARARDADGAFIEPNIMTAGWTGIVNTKPPILSLSVRPERLTYDLIQASGEFVINLVQPKLASRADYCGVRSGRDTDKWADCGFHAETCPGLKVAPLLQEAAVSLACKVSGQQFLGSHELFLAEIVGLEIADALIDPDGKIVLDRLGLLSYAHGTYYELSSVAGFFGFSVAKAEVRKRRARKKNK